MFEKLKVVELASVLAGPAVGQFFAELGAEVIKVENPTTGGDVTRSWLSKGEKPKGTISAYFSAVNWGKQSVLLNLKDSSDLDKLYKLIKQADIVIASYKPGDPEKLGVSYEQLSAINPGLIYGHITGYGPDENRVGYDAILQAEAGFMSINGETEGGPLKMPVALIDILAAHHLKQGLLLAIINRFSTGKGDYVPVSLLDAAVSSLANQGANWLVGHRVPERKGNSHPNIAPYGDVFTTADDAKIILAVGSNKQFSALCEVLQIEMIEGFSTNALRVENRQHLNEIITEKIRQSKAGALLEKCRENAIPVGLVKSIDIVMKDGKKEWFLNAAELTGVRSLMSLPGGLSPISLSAPPQLGENINVQFEF